MVIRVQGVVLVSGWLNGEQSGKTTELQNKDRVQREARLEDVWSRITMTILQMFKQSLLQRLKKVLHWSTNFACLAYS